MYLIFMRGFPMIMNIFLVLVYVFSHENFYLKTLLVLTASGLSNHILKEKVFKPLMGNKNFPIIGIGKRPHGAKNCGLIHSNNLSKSYGMPSGHAQYASLLSTILSLKLYYSNHNNNVKVLGLLGFILITCLVAHSRIMLKCHTLQQTILGGLIGIFIGYKSYKYT